MTKEEIKRIVEENIAYQCNEYGLTREEVAKPVFYGMLEMYLKDDIDIDDLEEAGRLLQIGIIKSELVEYKRKMTEGDK